MYPINTAVFTQQPSFTAPVHRALVVYADNTTGEVQVKIPSIFGNDTTVSLSFIGRSAINGAWHVPNVGDQIIVTSDDPSFNNIYWVSTDPANAQTNYFEITTQPDTTYVLKNSDVGNLLLFTNSSTITVTIPPASPSNASWVASNNVSLLQKGTGQIVISADVGVTIYSTGLLKTRDQYSAITLIYLGNNEWFLHGDTAVI